MSKKKLAEIKKKSVSGAISYFLRTLLLNGISFVASVILSFRLTPEEFGIYGIVIQIIAILIFFSDIGLAATLIQKEKEPSRKEYLQAFSVQMSLALLLVVVTLVLRDTPFVTRKIGEVGGNILLALGISFPLATLKTIPSVILERKLEFQKVVIPQIVENLFFNGLLIGLVLKGMGVEAYVYAILARSISGVITMYIIKPWRIGFILPDKSVTHLLKYGVQFQLNDMLARIKDNLFYLVLGFMLPLKQFGLVHWAKTWSMYPYNLTVQNVLAITFPAFSRLQGHQQQLKRAIEKSLFFITASIYPILAGMCLFIVPLLTVFPGYNKWLPASMSFIFFTLSIGWSAISSPLTNALNAIGQVNKTLKLMILWTGLTWTVSPVLVLYASYHGIAIAAFIISLTSLLPFMMLRKVVKINLWDQMYRQLFAVVCMSLVALAGFSYWQESITLLATGICLSGMTYLVSFFLIGKDKIIFELKSLRST